MNNSRGWVFKTLKECCDVHYSWNYDQCMEAPISPMDAPSTTTGITSTTAGSGSTSSSSASSSKLCRNPNAGQHIRFYDLSITATDFAGNTNSDICKVIIIPFCDPSHFSGEICHKHPTGNYYYSKTHVDNTVDSSSQILFTVARTI